jgi:hypothetical protein
MAILLVLLASAYPSDFYVIILTMSKVQFAVLIIGCLVFYFGQMKLVRVKTRVKLSSVETIVKCRSGHFFFQKISLNTLTDFNGHTGRGTIQSR